MKKVWEFIKKVALLVWKFIRWIVSTIESPTGGISSKRVYGALCFVAAYSLGQQGAPAAVVAAFLAAASAVFVAQAASGT
jgi:hypothetical protein